MDEIEVYDPSMDPVEPAPAAAGSAASGGRDWSCLAAAPAASPAAPEPVRMSPEQLSMAIEQLLMSNGYRLNVEPRYAISLVDVTAQ